MFRLKDKNSQEIIITNKRARAILAMFCLAPDEPLEREFVSHLLWPGCFEAQVKASLRQCLLELGTMFTDQEDQVLVISRSQIILNSAAMPTDLFCLEGSVAQANYNKAAQQLTIIAGRALLDQLNVGDTFEEWLENQRVYTQQRLKTLMTGGAALGERKATAQYNSLLDAWKLRSPSWEPAVIHRLDNEKTKLRYWRLLPLRHAIILRIVWWTKSSPCLGKCQRL